MMNFKAIVTVIFSAVLMFCLTACKDTPKSADNSSSNSVAVSDTMTTTSTTTTAATTTGTKRKTTTTTTTSAATTQTTLVTTVTTVPTTTTALATTVTTTATTSAVTTPTAAPIVTTTVATATTTGATSTASTAIPTGNLTPTLKAYSDLAEYGVLTDEIRELITQDVLNYATGKYNGLIVNPNLYANSKTDYNSTFFGGAKNEYFKAPSAEEIELYESWGIDMSEYKNATLEQFARGFQEEIYNEVDYALSDGSDGIGCYVGFCELYREGDYVTYQVSFLLGLDGLL